MAADLVSVALTQGIRVTVRSQYLPDQSSPAERRYVFSYTVKLENEGKTSAKLDTRHWIITDGTGKIEEVRGPGVVGKHPVLEPGGVFEYTSGCILRTAHGSMHGTYQMVREDGSRFDATIAPFSLTLPHSLN
jgi:ApaG protein